MDEQTYTLLFRVKIIAHSNTWLSCLSPAKFHFTREIHPDARLRARRSIDSDFVVTHFRRITIERLRRPCEPGFYKVNNINSILSDEHTLRFV